jgi:hypothetical protein
LLGVVPNWAGVAASGAGQSGERSVGVAASMSAGDAMFCRVMSSSSAAAQLS